MLPAELVATERLLPLAAMPSGELLTIDRAQLSEMVERLAQATAAIERGNQRALGVKTERRCVEAVLRTGVAPAECAAR